MSERLSKENHKSGLKKKEIAITKELARRLRKKLPNFQIYANKCPSKSKKVKKVWTEVFRESCPPLQPEIDIIIMEPPNPYVRPCKPSIRAIEIKHFEKIDGRINQSFYKGIEQSLALLRWGFDNVALWQLFGESCSEEDIRNYGFRTWSYIRLLGLPIEFNPFKLIGLKTDSIKFLALRGNWLQNISTCGAELLKLIDIEAPKFPIRWRNLNPLANEKFIEKRLTFKPQIGKEVIRIHGADKLIKEVTTLRQFLLDWLPKQRSGLDE